MIIIPEHIANFLKMVWRFQSHKTRFTFLSILFEFVDHPRDAIHRHRHCIPRSRLLRQVGEIPWNNEGEVFDSGPGFELGG
mmetsp:Transcript_8885/g.6641  ORF Transcript_8885/g.6641 Transcript_8885/m.6641 type:complete len:81 (-) Transcript_8885:1400-1642(-)